MPALRIAKSPAFFLSLAMLSFCACLLPCFWLMPRFFHDDLGISNYGVHRQTVFLYSLGFISSACFFFRAAQALLESAHIDIFMSRWLRVIGWLLIALLIVPDVPDRLIRYSHIAIGLALFGAEMILSLEIAFHHRGKGWDRALFCLQSLAFLSVILSLLNILFWEAQSQLIYEISFMALCVRAAQRLAQPVHERQGEARSE